MPRTAAEWEAEPNVERLAKCYRGRHWFAPLRLFAVACARRVWDEIPVGVCRDAVEVAERFARGQVGKPELWTAWRDAQRTVEAAVRVSETSYVYGTLAEARPSVASACALPAEHPAYMVPRWACQVVGLLRWEAVTAAGATWWEAEAARGERIAVEQVALAALLREMVGNPFAVASGVPGSSAEPAAAPDPAT